MLDLDLKEIVHELGDAAWCEGKNFEDWVEPRVNAILQALDERGALKAELTATQSRLHEVAVACTNAEAELEAARKQEPYGYMHILQTGSGNIIKQFCFSWENPQLGPVREDEVNRSILRPVPLYASPVQAQQGTDMQCTCGHKWIAFDPQENCPRCNPAQQSAEVTPEYPMQPMFLDKGLPRFEKNPIVDWLCEKHGLNEIGIWWQVNNVEQKYIEQLYQLIGYSIRGYEELSNVSDTSFDKAKSMAEQLLKGGENER